MGKVTDIKTQVKHKERVSIYVDGKYSFSLSVWQLGSMKIRIGDELDESQIDELKDSSETGKLYDKALNWLLIRPRSKWEIEDYLFRKTKDDALRARVFERIQANGFVNDVDFAQRWVNNRRLLKPMSTYRLKQELLKKRVPMEVIDETLQNDTTEDLDTVKQLIVKKQSRYKDQEKLMAYLARQGYSYGVIKQALEELED